jgi:hypothetical protein
VVITAAAFAALLAAPLPSRSPSPLPAVARVGAGEVIVDASAPLRPPSRGRVHGHARLGLGFGVIAEDPAAVVEPGVVLDLRSVAPLRLGFAVPLRLRLYDRAPDDRGALRLRDWDEVGDYLAIVRLLEYRDDHAIGRRAHAHVEVVLGVQRDVMLGHGSLVRGWANGLDIDRRRSGLEALAEIRGSLLEQPAAVVVQGLAGDLAGSQILGARVQGRWAGAGLGASVVGDPTAPRRLVVDAGEPAAFELGRGGRLRSAGPRGVVAGSVELEYRATDRWRWSAGPYLDLDMVGGLGRGLHLGADAEGRLGRRRGVEIGATAELTVGSSGYDPAYFDVFYGATRWQGPLLGTASSVSSDVDAALPKYAWVRGNIPAGVGGMGALRFSHARGAQARVEYRARPGALGHTFALVVGADLRRVGLFARFAHRGDRHGFEPRASGTLAQLELRVPVLRWLDVDAMAGWTFGTRVDPRSGADGGSLVRGAGVVLAGVAGRVPW